MESAQALEVLAGVIKLGQKVRNFFYKQSLISVETDFVNGERKPRIIFNHQVILYKADNFIKKNKENITEDDIKWLFLGMTFATYLIL